MTVINVEKNEFKHNNFQVSHDNFCERESRLKNKLKNMLIYFNENIKHISVTSTYLKFIIQK